MSDAQKPQAAAPAAACDLPGAAESRTGANNRVEQRLLQEGRVIAVVGLSTDKRKDSQIVSRHMQRNGYRIVPIHPKADEIMGEKAYASIGDLPPELAAQVDILNLFRPSQEVPALVEQALAHLPNLKGIWTQKAIHHQDSDKRIAARGISLVTDRCIRTQQLYWRFVASAASEE